MPGAADALYKMHRQTTKCSGQEDSRGQEEDSRGVVMKFTWGKTPIAAVAMVVSSWAPDVGGQIDKSSQRMAVSVDGTPRYNWPVSTGAGGYGTPTGVFHPQSM